MRIWSFNIKKRPNTYFSCLVLWAEASVFLISSFINVLMGCHVITLETDIWSFEMIALSCPRAWAYTQGSPGSGTSSVIKTPDPNDFPVCKLNNNIKTKSTESNRKRQIYQRGLPAIEVIQIPVVKKSSDWDPPAENGKDDTQTMVPQASSFTTGFKTNSKDGADEHQQLVIEWKTFWILWFLNYFLKHHS